MTTERYDVEGRVRLNAGSGLGALQSFSGQLRGITGQLGTIESGFGRLVGAAVTFGGAYVGINAISGAISGMTRDAFAFEQEMQGMQIGIAQLMTNVEGITFAEAMTGAQEVSDQLQLLAVDSSATTAQLTSIYQGIYGPIRRAGASMEDLLTLTGNSANAAAALGIDYAQASRDISGMARGTAGMDNRTFSMLTSMGLITESAQEFNRLNPAERLARLQSAFAGFAEGGSVMGATIAGQVSTLTDAYQLLRRAFYAPIFARLTESLASVNNAIKNNFGQIRDALTRMGTSVGAILTPAFDFVGKRIIWVANHFDQVTRRIYQVGNRMADVVRQIRQSVPQIMRAARLFGELAAARQILGTAAALAPAAGAAGSAVLQGGAGLAGLMGTGSALGTLTSAAALLSSTFLVAAGWLGVFWGAIDVATEYWDLFVAALAPMQPIFMQLQDELIRLWGLLGKTLGPVFRTMGATLLGVLIPAFQVGATAFLRLVQEMNAFLERLGEFTGQLEQGLANMVRSMTRFQTILSIVLRSVSRTDQESRTHTRRRSEANNFRVRNYSDRVDQEAADRALDERPAVNNDFRGSRITVNQEFRQSDPDRVFLQMVEDINAQAERRIQTGVTNALTR